MNNKFKYIWIAVMLLTGLSGWRAQSQNLYTDSNAASVSNEANSTTGWGGTAVISSDGSDPYHGSYAIRGVSSATNGRELNFSFNATVGETYAIKIWAKRGAQSFSPAFANWTGVSGFNVTPIGSVNWQEYYFVVTATSATPNIKAYTSPSTGGSQGDTVFIDSISIEVFNPYLEDLHTSSNAASIDYEANGTTGWTGAAVITSDATNPYHGQYALRASSSATNGRDMGYTFSAVVGQSYTIKIRAREGTQSFSPAFANWSGLTGFTNPTPISGTAWNEYTFNVTATSASPIIRVYTSPSSGGSQGDTVFIDSVSILAQDTEAPSQVTGLSLISSTGTTADISWTAATDNAAVSGYKVYKDGVLEATLGDVLSYSVTALTPNSTYSFTVSATDAAGNEGVQSTALSVSTLAPYTAISLDSNENYVYTRAYQNAKDSANDISSDHDVIEGVTYFDGLGRPKQQIGIKQSPTLKDIVAHITYDQYGRQHRQYLPYSATGTLGSHRNDAEDRTTDYYVLNYPDDLPQNQVLLNAYSETAFEASPLNRPLQQAAPGNIWGMGNGHEIKFEYLSNTTDTLSSGRTSTVEREIATPTSLLEYDDVRLFRVNFVNGNTSQPELTEIGFYDEGTLYKTTTRDENWIGGHEHTTDEFKDQFGRVVLKRTYELVVTEDDPRGGQIGDPVVLLYSLLLYDTYYIYDDFGNLSYVLPPKAIESLPIHVTDLNADIGGRGDIITVQQLIDEVGYQYKYDRRNRLTEKKIPGKGWEYIVYNSLDQPVLTQDANLRANGEWLYTKYDAFGRVILTGKYTNSINTQAGMQTALDDYYTNNSGTKPYESMTGPGNININGASVGGYSNQSFPIDNTEAYTIHHFDEYFIPPTLVSMPSSVFGQTVKTNLKGLPTSTITRVLGTQLSIINVIGYDEKARPIWVYNRNVELGITDIVETSLDFAGKVLETKSTHTRDGGTPIVVTERFTYDHAARVLRQTHKVDNEPEELIAQNEYDEISQLTVKKVGNTITNPLQEVNYSYNIRGWLKAINDVDNIGNDLFSFKINYNDPTSGTALYNGNISQTHWRTANTDSSLKTYTYSYDGLNRIISAIDNTGNYNLNNVSYDLNGNITALSRQGHINAAATSFNEMDDLEYEYSLGSLGNRLVDVEDGTSIDFGFKDFEVNGETDYSYDANGNMIKDNNKGITSIDYNHLNLPTEVVFDNDQNKKINYIYDAAGIKIKKIVTDGSSLTTTEYAGNFIYKNNNLQFFNTAEGYVEPDGSNGYDYIYQYKDHLGNIRLAYSDDNGDGTVTQAEIREENNYYPFGLKHKGYNSAIVGGNHKYGFTGKEEQDELGLAWIDITARNYDAALGRWMNIDPLAEEMRRHSPYNYAFDNPIYYIDPDGMMPIGIGENENDTNFDFINKESQAFEGIYNFNVDTGEFIKISDEGDDIGQHVINFVNSGGAQVGVGFVNTQPGSFTPGELLENDGAKLFGGLINSGLLSEQAKRRISSLTSQTGVNQVGQDFGTLLLVIGALPIAIEAGIASSPAVSRLVSHINAIVREIEIFTSVRGGTVVRTNLNALKNFLLKEGLKVFRKHGSKGLREFLKRKGLKKVVKRLQKADVGELVNSKTAKRLYRTLRTIYKILE
ncbi:hypothetical protein GWK08_06650 [Leptobacterium flavescens]|uniref:Fibronectin type-III domain-containing protein n=1 Tax=Leptobacterium flavescens TaxID=472055 RepID=A0A6P0UID6_9FLAO|nr:DUF6443 domain-containing protein [Leptobacterium flavescens]NER13111.1 hypothetical protein [Leptobacterium flavescens]